jgi:hypothetical protein
LFPSAFLAKMAENGETEFHLRLFDGLAVSFLSKNNGFYYCIEKCVVL